MKKVGGLAPSNMVQSPGPFDGKYIAFHLQDQRSAHIYLETPVLLPEALKNHLGPEFENQAVQVAIVDPPKQHQKRDRTVWRSNLPIAKMVPGWKVVSSHQH